MKVFEYVSNCYCGVNNHLVVFLVIIAPAIYKEHGSWTLYTIIVYTYIICICKYTCLPTNYHVRCTNLGCFTTLKVGFWAPVQVGAPISISQHYEILSNSPSMPIFIPVEDHLESYQNILKHIKKNNSTSICDSKLWGTDDQLPRLLAESDFVVVAVPLLPATRNMIGVKAVVTARVGWCDISRSYPGWFVMTVMNYGWCGI